MTRTFALRFALIALAALMLAGCNNSPAPSGQPQAADQPGSIEFPAPKDVEQRAKAREQAAQGAAQASSTQGVGGELGDMYKKAQQAPASSSSAAH